MITSGVAPVYKLDSLDIHLCTLVLLSPAWFKLSARHIISYVDQPRDIVNISYEAEEAADCAGILCHKCHSQLF